MDRFEFTPPNGFESTTDYPDPSTETQARQQLMSLHNQLKDYVNTMADAVTAIEGATGDAQAIQDIQDAVSLIENFLLISPDVCYLVEE